MNRLATILLFAATAASSSASDYDRDGLDDEFEQELLRKFVPTFFVQPEDCDVLPAEFRPDSLNPVIVGRNGTIYGQVFKSPMRSGLGAFIEIHYFHLWARDCGRAGHAFDPEHVSALVRAADFGNPAADWKAIYWYAAAHEDTTCDVSSGSRAAALKAETRGPAVWISKGKHASFLSQSHCSYGCGGDLCAHMTSLVPGKLINLGELHAPLNGAVWIHSTRWPLAAKLTADFSDVVVAQLEDARADAVVTFKTYLRPAQAFLLAGDSTFDALNVSGRSTDQALGVSFTGVEDSLHRSGRNTGKALSRSGVATGNALDASARSVGRSLQRTGRGIENFFRLKKPVSRSPDAATNPSDHQAELSPPRQ